MDYSALNNSNQTLAEQSTSTIGPLDEASPEFKVIACININSFYAQAEARRFNIDDNSIPVAVIQWRSCFAMNYAAKEFGISRSMTIENIKKTCPDAFLIHVDTVRSGEPYIDPYKRSLEEKRDTNKNRNNEKISFDYFRLESDKVTSLVKSHCEIVEKVSIDEFFLDLTEEVYEIYNRGDHSDDWIGNFLGGKPFQPGTAEEIVLMIGTQVANKIREEISKTFKYTSSIGVSYNKMLSKIALDHNKPNVQNIIAPRYTEEALKPHEISRIRHFDGRVAEVFEQANIRLLEDLQSMNLKEIKCIVDDDHCAKWIYFRCRGYDNERVEEKDHTNKAFQANTPCDRTVMNILDLENIEDIIVSDLSSRLIGFCNQSNTTPSTLALHYRDNLTRERKIIAGEINLRIKQEMYFDTLKAKTHQLIKKITSVLFPCKYLAISAKNFQKNDFKDFGFDLKSYMKGKQKTIEPKKDAIYKEEYEGEPRQEESEKRISIADFEEYENFKDFDKSITIQEDYEYSYTSSKSLKAEELQIWNDLDPKNPEDVTHDYGSMIKKEDASVGVQSQQVKCEICSELIEEHNLADHLDFHIAQNLDKELNPNKRKYRKIDNGEVTVNVHGKSCSQKDVIKEIESQTTATRGKMTKDQTTRSKKNTSNSQKNPSKNSKIPQMKSLETFFTKK